MFFESKKLKDRISELEEENERLSKALSFYASNSTWSGAAKYRDADDATVFADTSTTRILEDNGRRARNALDGKD